MVNVNYLAESISRVKRKNEPWVHYVVDTFFDPRTAAKLLEYECFCSIDANDGESTSDELTESLRAAFDSDIVRAAFNNISPQPLLPELTVTFRVQKHHRGFMYPIHSDMAHKKASVVVYLGNSPECDGTKLHTYYGDEYHSTIPFKHNRAVIFFCDGGTNHSYGPFEGEWRRSLVFNYWDLDL